MCRNIETQSNGRHETSVYAHYRCARQLIIELIELHALIITF